MPALKKVDEPVSAGLLTTANLVLMFESSEDATVSARKLSERDRDYVDNIQYTADEIKELNHRKQPVTIVNRIKRKIDFLKGFELSQRVDPRALPRTVQHEQEAEGTQQALRYIADEQRFDVKRSQVWDNLLVEGMGGYRVGVKQGMPGPDGGQPEMQIEINRIPWDRMFYDPHSSEPDFSDARYLGIVRWEDFDEALAQYPDRKDALEITMTSVSHSQTYDDKPKFRVWADRKRRRVRIVQIWIKRQEQWHFAEFTRGGILKSGPSPYQTDKGESDCELIFGSAYINRENERYGIVREMVPIQDEVNKRRSKALHLLNTSQIVMEDGAVQNLERTRREAARPDGVVTVNPGYFERFKFETRTDLATGHLTMLQEAKNEIDMMAGNIALQGGGTGANRDASGKAIIASQQGGAMEIAPLISSLRAMDIRVYRAAWARVRQYWTSEKWVRVTDDERNIKWLGLNIDPMQQQMLAQEEGVQDKIVGLVTSVAGLDVDIIIDDAPDGLTPQLEQFQSLVELKKMDANGELPFRAIVAAMPNLKNKERVMAAMDEAKSNPQAAQAAAERNALEVEGAKQKIRDTGAGADKKMAETEKILQGIELMPAQFSKDVQAQQFDQDTRARQDNERQQTEAEATA